MERRRISSGSSSLPRQTEEKKVEDEPCYFPGLMRATNGSIDYHHTASKEALLKEFGHYHPSVVRVFEYADPVDIVKGSKLIF